MPWCPVCKEEFRDGFTKCSECGAALVDNPPQEIEEQQKPVTDVQIQEKLLISTDSMQSQMIIALLKEANIPYVVRDRGAGGWIKIGLGFSVFGTDIYVAEDDYDKAKELVDSCFAETGDDIVNEAEPEDEYDPEEDGEPEEKGNNGSFAVRRIIMRMIMGLLFLSAAYGILKAVLWIIKI